MRNILLITTTYRTGEKMYPIIPELSKYFTIDVLNMFQMSPDTKLPKEGDYRGLFKSKYNSYINKEYNGPGFAKDSRVDGNRSMKFVEKFEKILSENNYSIAIWDNNVPTKGGSISDFYKIFSKYNIKVIGSPHANKYYQAYKLGKRIGASYDYSFVFGEKERCKLSRKSKNKKFSTDKVYSRFMPAGIPSNDALKSYKKTGKYILIIPNFTEYQDIKSISRKIEPLTKKAFLKLKILSLSDKFGCKIIIKEKPRAFYHEHKFRDSLSKYDQIEFLSHCEDDNKLMADAKMVIGAPSTFMFKPIQLGLPTVLFEGMGEVANFSDYPGLVDPSYKNIINSIDFQMKHGRFDDYIKRTLSGGVEFNSIDLYVNFIRNICKNE